MRFVPRMSLPLLRKEMVETAARRRTYSMRFLYALTLFTIWCLVLWRLYQQAGGDPDRLTGQGRFLYDTAMQVQLAALYLFLPAMVAGAITSERENKTMTLLIVTDLRPWEILVQKMVGRMLPVLTFLFLSMPLAAMAYLFGGVETHQVAISLYVLVVTAVQVAAAAVFVSTFCKSTVSALLVCYLVGPLIYLMAIIGNIVVGVLWMGVVYLGRGALGLAGDFESELLLNAFPPALLFAWDTQSLAATVVNTVPAWLVSALFILMARDELVAGTLAMGPQAPVNMQFTQTDSIPDAYRREPPTDRPVAWRMGVSGAGAAGTIRVTLAGALTLVFGFFAMGLTTGDGDASLALLGFIAAVTWIILALVLGVLGSGVVASERACATLDVLLTTPITGSDLLDQKMQTVRRWRAAFVIVLAVLAALKWLTALFVAAASTRGRPLMADAVLYGLFALAAVAVYPTLLMWFAVWVGLTVRTHAKAALTTLLAVAAFTVGLAVVPGFLGDVLLGYSPRWLSLFSPLGVLLHNESLRPQSPALIALQLTACAVAAAWLARHCRRRIDTYLGRVAPDAPPPEPPPPDADANPAAA